MRKWIAALLASVMMLLPLTGLAENPAELMDRALEAGLTLETQLKITPGDLPFGDANAPVADMLDALGVTLQQSKDGVNSFALQLGEEDAFRGEVEVKDGRTYLRSNWLGDQVLSFTEEEAVAFMQNLAPLMGLEAEDMTSMQDMPEAELEMPEFSEQELQPMVDFLTELFQRAETAPLPQQPRASAPAATVMTLTLTAEDIAKFYEVTGNILLANESYMAMLEMLNVTLSLNGETMPTEQALKELPAQIRAQADAIKDIPLAVYLNDAQEVVLATMSLEIATDEESVSAECELARQTTNDGMGWSANVDLAVDGTPAAAITLSYLADSQTADAFTLSILAKEEGKDDTEMLLLSYMAQKEYEKDRAAKHAIASFVFRPELDAEPLALTLDTTLLAAHTDGTAMLEAYNDLFLTGEESPVLTLSCITKNVDAPESLSKAADIVKPGTLEDTELQAFVQQVLVTVQTSLMRSLQLLPASVLNLMMSGM